MKLIGYASCVQIYPEIITIKDKNPKKGINRPNQNQRKKLRTNKKRNETEMKMTCELTFRWLCGHAMVMEHCDIDGDEHESFWVRDREQERSSMREKSRTLGLGRELRISIKNKKKTSL
jgi:hypothetical protein